MIYYNFQIFFLVDQQPEEMTARFSIFCINAETSIATKTRNVHMAVKEKPISPVNKTLNKANGFGKDYCPGR